MHIILKYHYCKILFRRNIPEYMRSFRKYEWDTIAKTYDRIYIQRTIPFRSNNEFNKRDTAVVLCMRIYSLICFFGDICVGI